VVEEGLQVRLAGLLRRLVDWEEWEEEFVLRLLEGFVVAIQNRALLELEKFFRWSGCWGFFVHVPLVQKVVVREMVASLLMQKVGETAVD
jgi:hypothetical protein